MKYSHYLKCNRYSPSEGNDPPQVLHFFPSGPAATGGSGGASAAGATADVTTASMSCVAADAMISSSVVLRFSLPFFFFSFFLSRVFDP